MAGTVPTILRILNIVLNSLYFHAILQPFNSRVNIAYCFDDQPTATDIIKGPELKLLCRALQLLNDRSHSLQPVDSYRFLELLSADNNLLKTLPRRGEVLHPPLLGNIQRLTVGRIFTQAFSKFRGAFPTDWRPKFSLHTVQCTVTVRGGDHGTHC